MKRRDIALLTTGYVAGILFTRLVYLPYLQQFFEVTP